jgi:formylglycine-generating enzyme required for sulfatase activity
VTLEALLAAALGDRYVVKRELGQGGMATVFLAEERHPQREVAIKVMEPALAAAIGGDRFLREIEICARFSHPHVVPIFAAGDAGGLLYYVMPYLTGESLRSQITRERMLPVADALRIAAEVADALDYAHRHGVVHRDIKPENIMMEDGHAIVTDFGVARAAVEAGGEKLTQTGVTVGTPLYMSPEQAAGDPQIDGRSDVYSLGCVVYEMIGGTVPFTGPSAQAVLARQITDPAPPLGTLRPGLPQAVIETVHLALAKTPADRFRSAADFARALRGELTTSGGLQAVRRTVRRRWRVGAIVTGVAALIGVALAGRAALVDRGPAAPPGMVLVPGGEYHVFGGAGRGCRLCLPERASPLDTFYIDRTEVTVGQYAAFVANAGRPAPWRERPDTLLPVTGVMWQEAADFCAWRAPGGRLPREEEWEAATRGRDGRRFPWGNTWQPGRANAASSNPSVTPVGSYPLGASPLRALDLIGNAWEWTLNQGPTTPSGLMQHIIRGGAFNSPDSVATAYYRIALPAAVAEGERARYYGNTGFRCAKDHP